MKKNISLVVAFLIIFISFPALALTPESGMIGDSLTWKIKNHMLTIMGEGDMPNWKSNESVPPWYNRDNVMAVEIKDGVTNIGNGAFSGLRNLTGVDIPDSVTSIGNYAFDTCISLPDIIIPDGVEYIGDGAFNACENLENIRIPDAVRYIGYDAFSYCRALKSINIPDDVKDIRSGAFKSCSSLETIRIPEDLSSIGYGSFSGCRSLKSVRIPKTIKDIADSAFAGCGSLENINIPSGIKSIGYHSFDSCKSLESISIPKSVTAIGWYAFERCGALTDVYYGGSEEDWNAIKLGAGNECLTNAQIHYNSAVEEEKPEIKTLSVTTNGTDVLLAINDNTIDFPDAKPFIDQNDRTQIPIRAVAEMLDSEVAWDAENKIVEITSKNDDIIALVIDSDIMTVNGENVKMDTAAIIKDDRTYIPVRFVAEAMGLTVEWSN